jgi:thiamine transport system permease protein
MGAYRMDQAAATAVVLVVQSLFLFWMFDRGGRGHATLR